MYFLLFWVFFLFFVFRFFTVPEITCVNMHNSSPQIRMLSRQSRQGPLLVLFNYVEKVVKYNRVLTGSSKTIIDSNQIKQNGLVLLKSICTLLIRTKMSKFVLFNLSKFGNLELLRLQLKFSQGKFCKKFLQKGVN